MRPWTWYRKIQRRSRRKEVLERFLTGKETEARSLGRWLDERLSAGDRSEVGSLLRELPEPSTLDPVCFPPLIEACYRARYFERGLEIAGAWQAREPESPAPLNSAARLHSLAGRPEQAHELHRLALQRASGRAESWYQLGCTHLREEQLDAAEAAFREALRIEPRLGRAYTNLGFALDRRGEHALAVQQFKRAIELDPDNAAAHLNLGALYAEGGETDLAIPLFRRALALRPDSLEARMGLGMLYFKAARYGEAIGEFEAVLAQQPQHCEALYHGAVCLGRLGARRRALQALRKAERLAADDRRIQFQLGLCLLNMDAYEKALPHFLQAREASPHDPRCAYYLGILYDKLGRRELAEENYRLAERMGSGGTLVRATVA